ncbi:MAG TPA: phenylalanine--tRNA ligase subunit beta [bacterium]|mgnify:CR=1 FL=1|nr:phenylalanine--tRNA ligase subunit beta [bacterium]
MRVTYRWLKEYVDFSETPQELAAKLTMLGHEVEGLEKIGGEFSGVITARIEAVQPHPEADKLTICQVFDGEQTLQVICGAPNTQAGKIGAFAAIGAQLPEGKVKKIKMRGVDSYGMLCSKAELGVSADHSGLWYLPDDAPLGRPVQEVVELDDWVYEINITPNRPDCLSAIGLAREIAARTGKPLKLPEAAFEPVGGEIDRYMQVIIEDPVKCPRYTGILVKGIAIAPSPDWMANRLEAAGVRAINNIVDITNYVLLECGQPLHAFDYHFLADKKIVVRRAGEGETITTLDEQERKLTDDDLLICDGRKPVALAGIMGGLNSLVTDQTVDVFIESAFFEPTGIRRSSKRIGLSSESSYRFEREIDRQAVSYGLHRATRLMEQFGGGKVVPGYIDQYPTPWEPKVVRVRPDKINGLIGLQLSREEIARLLTALEFGVENDGDDLLVRVPPFRVDVAREADIAEETARLYNYDLIPETLHKGADAENRPWKLRSFLRDLRRLLVGMGLIELNSISFLEQKQLDAVYAPRGIRVANPLSEDLSVLRTSLLPSLLRVYAYNKARLVPDVKVFEARRVFLPKDDPQRQPDEPHRLGLLLSGRRHEVAWNLPADEVDFYDLKGVVEALLKSLGIGPVTWERPAETGPYLPGVCAVVKFEERVLGIIGKINAEVLEAFDTAGKVFAGELEIDRLADLARTVPAIEPISKFPPIFRDIAVLVDADAPVDQMIEAIKQVNSKQIAEVKVFDLYTGKGVPDGKKSVAFSMRYQDILKSLSDADGERLTSKILNALQHRFGASLRE